MQKALWRLWLVLALFIGVQMIGFSLQATANSSEVVEGQRWGNKAQITQSPDGFPKPKEGFDDTEQISQPVSTIPLQQRYPETIFLHGPLTENRIALTFDDGPDPRFTPQVLDVLKEYHVPATFFVIGAKADDDHELVRRIHEEGHILGNHTYSHPIVIEQTKIAVLEREIAHTEEVLENLVGYRTRLFREPYGFLYSELVETLVEMNYTAIGWNVDLIEWRGLGKDDSVTDALSNIVPGSIILMNDGGGGETNRFNTIESLHQIIPTLQAQGFEFVTVPELLNISYQK